MPSIRTVHFAVTRGIFEDSSRTGDAILFWLGFGAAVSILFSIAVSQILLGVGLLWAVYTRRFDFPPIKLPLALFFVTTVAADLLSGHPLTGLPQIRKFFVFGVAVLAMRAFRGTSRFRLVLITWTGIAVLSGVDGFIHVMSRWRDAIRLNWKTYDYFVDDRITGFASHWMTFGGEQMIVLLMLLSFLLFSCPRRWRIAGWCCAGIIWVSLMLGLTRSIFLLGVPVGALYLLCAFRPRSLFIVPVVALASYFVMPFQVRERVSSVLAPRSVLDSNQQRYVTRRTGWEMVKAHPWFGLGPEQIKPQFDAYVPADIPRPLPRGWYGHLHNIYLQYAAERGIPALIFMLWMLGRMAADFCRALYTNCVRSTDRYLVHGAMAVIAAVLAEGMFEYNLGDSEILTMFLIVATSAYGVIGKDSAERLEPLAPEFECTENHT